MNVVPTQADAEALAQLEALLGGWSAQTQDEFEQLGGIAAANEPMLPEITRKAADQARALRETRGNIASLVDAQHYVDALVLVSQPPGTSALQEWARAPSREQEALDRLRAQQQDLLDLYIIHAPAALAEQLQFSAREVIRTIDTYEATPLAETSASVTSLEATLQAARASINAPQQAYLAAQRVHQELIAGCILWQAACPAPPMLPADEQASIALTRSTCMQARSLTETWSSMRAGMEAINATDGFTLSPEQEQQAILAARQGAPVNLTPQQRVQVRLNLTEPLITIIAACDRERPALPDAPSARLTGEIARPPVELAPVIIPRERCTGASQTAACGTNASYPVLFVHGHSFSDRASPEYSLQAFDDLARALQDEGRLSLGRVFPAHGGSLGARGMPGGVTASTTYYYDTYAEEGTPQLVIRKSEPIESYALRLRESIATLEERTGEDKVIIVAHSMGGLVARRYIQLFGKDDVAALVMIGTPNHGISGRTQRLCPWVGEDRECEDMRPDSLLLRKLNNAAPPTIPTLTIAGVGCEERGFDGVIEADSVALDWARNEQIIGTCDGSRLLHSGMLDVTNYPETLRLVTDFLDAVDRQ